MHTVLQVAAEFWSVLAEMAPYLLFGFLFAGILSVLISAAWVERQLGGSGLWPVTKASLYGIPLPLCSCSVVPVTASLRRHGASRAATTSFLISTPQTGVDSIAVTFSLLGPVFTVFRPVAALISGLIGGMAVAAGVRREVDGSIAEVDPSCGDACCSTSSGGRLKRILHYGFVALPQDIGRSLLIGLVVAGLIAVAIPDDYLTDFVGRGLLSMLAMMALGIPIYVCATASVPVAAALIAKGITPGAALVFLMTGPATNAAAIAMLWRVMGRRAACIYLGAVAVTALASGFALDAIYSTSGVAMPVQAHDMLPAWLQNVAAVVLLTVLAVAMVRPKQGVSPEAQGTSDAEQGVLTLAISGMSCNHCVQSVRRALEACPGVTSVNVQLSPGQAQVAGQAVDTRQAVHAVEELGYDVELTNPA